MNDLKNTEGIYFVGIGGIGMSALALYFARGGYLVAGYDRTRNSITDSLSREGCNITYNDDMSALPAMFKDITVKERVLIIYTPAIPAESRILTFFRNNGYRVCKRAEILGMISSGTDTIAVAGTHGKTTISTMIAHILKQSHLDCSAFLGGISRNYNTNLLLGQGRFTVMEADEYDRSFHKLSPLMAVITAVDADHLDIYGDQKTMIEAYNVFCEKIRPGGLLLINSRIKETVKYPDCLTCFTYGSETGANYRNFDIKHEDDFYRFSLKTPAGVMENLSFAFPGIINIENLTAAIAITLNCGVTENEIRKAIITFQGVRRRFEIRINLPGLSYVDDYAHHPEEIRAFIMSVREYFRGRKITGIFQPHLFSRTRDHAMSFARILDELDEVILLPVYPAREKPIEGVTSELIFNKMKLGNKRLLSMKDIPDKLDTKKLDVLVTIGAGDIDTLVGPIEEKLKKEGKV
jgi:UDP-N-acetylmuramate--alanine ligase